MRFILNSALFGITATIIAFSAPAMAEIETYRDLPVGTTINIPSGISFAANSGSYSFRRNEFQFNVMLVRQAAPPNDLTIEGPFTVLSSPIGNLFGGIQVQNKNRVRLNFQCVLGNELTSSCTFETFSRFIRESGGSIQLPTKSVQ